MILFEVLNRKLMLVDEIKNDPRKDAQAYAERVARGFRPEIPRKWPTELAELISSCWAQVCGEGQGSRGGSRRGERKGSGARVRGWAGVTGWRPPRGEKGVRGSGEGKPPMG